MGDDLNFNRKKILSMFASTLENIRNFDCSAKEDNDQTNIAENLDNQMTSLYDSDSEDSMSNFFNIS